VTDLDRLYQLPLSEFTKARDALAKQAPEGQRAAIRRLQKPNLPAWTVNQLYWKDRAAYNALIAAADRRRAAQLGMLAGKAIDLGAIEAEYARARKAAADRVRALLKAAGESATATTLNAVNETLEALPGPEGTPAGRLTRPLKPMGFEALTGLVRSGGARRPPATVLPFASKPPKITQARAKEREAERAAAAALKRAEAQAQREAGAKQKARARLETALRAAEAAEKRARAKVNRLRDDLLEAEDALSEAGSRRSAIDAELKRL